MEGTVHGASLVLAQKHAEQGAYRGALELVQTPPRRAVESPALDTLIKLEFAVQYLVQVMEVLKRQFQKNEVIPTTIL